MAGLALVAGFTVRVLSAWNHRLWQGNARFTLMVTSDPPVLVSYQSDPGDLLTLSFPANTEIAGSFNLGNWSLESLAKLGDMREFRGQVLTKSLQYELRVPIDGWMGEGGNILIGAQNGNGLWALLKGMFATRETTNLTFFDQWRLFWEVRGLSAAQRRPLAAEKIGLAKQARFADGQIGFKLDKEKIKTLALRDLQDMIVSQENVGVGIVNTTDIAGVGEKAAGVINTMGARVFWVRTQKGNVERCLIKTNSDSSGTLTVRRLAAIFNCEVKKDALAAPVEFMIGKGLAEEIPR